MVIGDIPVFIELSGIAAAVPSCGKAGIQAQKGPSDCQYIHKGYTCQPQLFGLRNYFFASTRAAPAAGQKNIEMSGAKAGPPGFGRSEGLRVVNVPIGDTHVNGYFHFVISFFTRLG
ncbi:MAG: hypothetical protein AB7H77_07580 [Bdellovibrionales bacterium]